MKTENSVEERFDRQGFVVDACKKCEGVGRTVTLTTSTYEPCDRCHGTGNEEAEYNRLKTFILQELSTARLELVKELREKIDVMAYKCTCGCEFKNGCLCFQNRDGYNQCLQEVDDILKETSDRLEVEHE